MLYLHNYLFDTHFGMCVNTEIPSAVYISIWHQIVNTLDTGHPTHPDPNPPQPPTYQTLHEKMIGSMKEELTIRKIFRQENEGQRINKRNKRGEKENKKRVGTSNQQRGKIWKNQRTNKNAKDANENYNAK